MLYIIHDIFIYTYYCFHFLHIKTAVSDLRVAWCSPLSVFSPGVSEKMWPPGREGVGSNGQQLRIPTHPGRKNTGNVTKQGFSFN